MQKKIKWLLSLYIAVIFIQSLFFKFTNSLETQHIFGVLGEWSGLAWFGLYGGYMVGVTELIAAIFLFIPAVHALGALMSLGVISGAILFHLFTPLGIVQPVFEDGSVVGNDGGLLFILACGIFVAAVMLLLIDSKSSNSLYTKIFRR